MKHILYVGAFDLPDHNAAALRVYNNAQIFKELNYKVSFLGINPEQKENKIIQQPNSDFDIFTQRKPKGLVDFMKYTLSIKNTKETIDLIGNIDFLILYDFQAIPNLRLLNYCKRKNINIIADCTEWTTTTSFSFLRRIIKSIDTFIKMRLVNKYNDGLIVISEYLSKYYKNQRTLLLPPLNSILRIDFAEYDKKKNSDSRILFFSGSIGDGKEHIDLLIDSIVAQPNLDKIRLYLVGFTEQQYINEYSAYTPDSRILFFGKKTHEETIKLLKTSHYGVLIRKKSRKTMAGFSTKLCEYISNGIYVIGTDTSDIKKYIKHQINGYIVHDDKNSIQDLLRNINSRNDLYLNKQTFQSNHNPFYYRNYIEQAKKFLEDLERSKINVQ
jgi:glycosyltransferase involved in cell wall biosynthesis